MYFERHEIIFFPENLNKNNLDFTSKGVRALKGYFGPL